MSSVLTMALDDRCEERFEQLRQQHFPPELNRVPAHVSLFHTLPELAEIETTLEQVSSETTIFPIQVDAVRSLGRGVSYALLSLEAVHLHRDLSRSFAPYLSAQDRQGFRPHVVVQNKTTTNHARETLALLQAAFTPWQCQATGLDLWQYLGGPWRHLRRFAFRAA